MAEPIDMLDLAKRLIPDIETHMPDSVRQAFESGQVKSIFRTGTPQLNPDGKRNPITFSTSGRPSSTYFLLDDGRAARYGVDDNTIEWMEAQRAKGASIDGAGWMGSRASVPKIVPNQDDPFVFDKILFGNKSESGLSLGGDIEKTLKESKTITDEPVVGKNIYETFSKDGKIITSHSGNAVTDVYTREGYATFYEDMANPTHGASPALVTKPVGDIDFVTKTGKELPVALPFAKAAPPSPPVTTVSSPTTPTPPDPKTTSRLRGTLAGETTAVSSSNPTSAPSSSVRARLRPTGISRKPYKFVEVSHIDGAKFEPLIPNMNINHGWKIHGDFVKDIASQNDAMAKIGIGRRGAFFEIADQSAWDAAAARLDKLGISTATDSDNLMSIAEGLIFQKRTEIAPGSTSMVNGRPLHTLTKFEERYSNPLDTISMMEVFDENQTQFKASAMYGEGREFTGYTQSIENRDKLISSLESRLGDRLEDVDPKILGAEHTEGATQLSKKITGRFTTEYTDIPSVGGVMDWSSQNPAASKGQDAIDNVMATNPQMRPYIHTGVIDDQSAANLQKLTNDFPVFNEMLHGPDGYVSPYGTIEDTFSQQGYDYKTGKAVAPSTVTTTPVNPSAPTTLQSAVATEAYDHGAEVAKATTSGEPLVESPPPKPSAPEAPVAQPSNAPISQRRLDALEEMAASGTEAEREIARKKLEELRRSGRAPRRGPGDLGTRVPIRTEPSLKGTDAAAPPPTGASVTPKTPTATVTTDAPKTSPTTTTSSGAPPKTKSLLDDAAEAARNVAKGHGNARTLGIVGAATLLGVGYATTRNKKNPPRDQGTYMDESRRRLGY